MKEKWIITIGREYCSGGAEAAKFLAERLGFDYLDKELIDKTAEMLDLSKEFIQEVQEQPEHRFQTPLHWYLNDEEPNITTSDAAMIFHAQTSIIEDYAKNGNVVIVGRCADYILADSPHLLRVFFYADINYRINRALDIFDISKENAEHLIMKTDWKRARYYNRNTRKRKWGSPKSYDLYLNLGRLGVDGVIDAIISEIERREAEE